MSERDANQQLSDTARMRMAYRCAFHNVPHNGTCPECDPLEDTQRMTAAEKRTANHYALAAHTAHLVCVDILRERRKPSTIGARAPETHRLDTVSERDQSAIESGVWPRYEP